MPAPATNSPPTFKYITVKRLHPTFGAEINGVDFSNQLTDEVLGEIFVAAKTVSPGACCFSCTEALGG